jgi:hypothetical protein
MQKHQSTKNIKRTVLAGLLIGFAVVISPVAFIAGVACLAYLFFKDKRTIPYFILGGLLGVAPLLWYNYTIFNNFITLPRSYIDLDVWGGLKENYGLQNPDPFVVLRIIFYPYKGLLFYYPILILSFVVLFFGYGYKKFSAEIIVAFLVLVGFLIMNSAWWAWWGGNAFGPRHLATMLPFLAIPLFYYFSGKLNRILKIAIIILFVISVAVNILGLNHWEDDLVSSDVSRIRPEYQEIIDTFQIMKNPILDHYIPLFIKNGPRSRLVESLFFNPVETDIRDSQHIKIREIRSLSTPYGFLVLKVTFLALVIVLCTTTLIWWDEFSKIFVYKGLSLAILLCIITIIIFISHIGFTNITYENTWHPTLVNETYDETTKWMGNIGKVYIFSPNATSKFLNISYENYRNKTLELYVNGGFIGSYMGNQLLENISLKDGGNEILITSKEGCERPSSIQNSSDPRCLSFGIESLELLDESDLSKGKIIYGNNWLLKEMLLKENETEKRYMSQNATLYVFLSENWNSRLNLTIGSYYKMRKLDMLVNGQKIEEYSVYDEPQTIVTPLLNLTKGMNIIELRTPDICVIPAKIKGINDQRCLGFVLWSIKFVEEDSILVDKNIIYSKGWGPTDKFSRRWMAEDAKIFVYVNESKVVKLNFDAASYHRNRTLYLLVNDEKMFEVKVANNMKNIFTPFFELHKGLNVFEFKPVEGCDVPAEVENTDDNRCLSFIIGKIKVIDEGEFFKKVLYAQFSNWYPEERTANNVFRWMADKSEIFIWSNKSVDVKIGFGAWTPKRNKTLVLSLNDKFIENYTVTEEPKEISFVTGVKSGENSLELYVKEGCDFPKNETRCLGIGISNFDLKHTD